jgi:predicted phage-related endonuclease
VQVLTDIEQGTDAWYAARAGIVTASEMSKVLAKGEGKTRAKYMNRLIAERITGYPVETYQNQRMLDGHGYEEEARQILEEACAEEIVKVGFIRNHEEIGGVGYSPDFLIGDEGIGELKSRNPDLQVELLLADRVPPEHKAQIQSGLWVSKRTYCLFASHCPGLPMFEKRVERDEMYIVDMKAEVIKFYAEMKEKLNQIMGR